MLGAIAHRPDDAPLSRRTQFDVRQAIERIASPSKIKEHIFVLRGASPMPRTRRVPKALHSDGASARAWDKFQRPLFTSGICQPIRGPGASFQMRGIGNVSAHYGERYCQFQESLGQDFLADALTWLFVPYIPADANLIDLGCAGGHLMERMPGKEKIGVEINPAWRARHHQRHLNVVSDLSEIPDAWADVVISNHALEHMPDPLAKLQLAGQKLRQGGRIIACTPCEGYRRRWVKDNIDQHLYTWAPINLGNLFTAAGFAVEEVERVAYRLPPKATLIQHVLGWQGVHFSAWLYPHLRPALTQVRIVAFK